MGDGLKTRLGRYRRPASASLRRLAGPRYTQVPGVMQPFLAGIACTGILLYILGAWNPTSRHSHATSAATRQGIGARGRERVSTDGSDKRSSGGTHAAATVEDDRIIQNRWDPAAVDGTAESPRAIVEIAENSRATFAAALRDRRTSAYFDAIDVETVTDALERYTNFAKEVLEADGKAVNEGRPLQGKYIVLQSGNELVNRLRGVLSGFLLGVVTDRVFVADITYQKDVTTGLLSALFEGPGYQWDLSQLSPPLRRALAPERSPSFRGAGSSKTLVFDMSKEHFTHWVCDDIFGAHMASLSVLTLSTVVYPLPLIARNPTYATHPLLSGWHEDEHGGATDFAASGQERIEILETVLTRIVLRPTLELRERAMRLEAKVREQAAAWAARMGLGESDPPNVVGIHVRTYFVDAVNGGQVGESLEEFAHCAEAGAGGSSRGKTFYFVATDEAKTQAMAKKVWGDGCYFEPFGLPGSRLEGIKSALVELMVMGSLDDYVMTPHSSFSELGSSLSYTWLQNRDARLRIQPNRPLVPMFSRMNAFEKKKVLSLLDRRASPIEGAYETGACMRSNSAGMSLAIAKGSHLVSMFEAIGAAPCFS